MPRFGFGLTQQSSPAVSFTSPAAAAPPPTMMRTSTPRTSSTPPVSPAAALALSSPPRSSIPTTRDRRTSSVNLCCASGDGRAVYTLNFQNGAYYLQQRSLPLHDDDEKAKNTTQNVQLPQEVQEALAENSPVELLYVEADAPVVQGGFKQHHHHRQRHQEEGQDMIVSPCLLCVYTRRNAFYLEMKEDDRGECLVETSNAFGHHLLDSDNSLTIIRIRSAPQRRMGYATLSPRGAMAMLAHNPYSNEYSILMKHNKKSDLVSVPVTFILEEVTDREESIADFVFAQSDGLSLFSSMTVLLLKGSGEVLAASPLLFHGSVVSKSVFKESMDYLDYEIERYDAASPKCKQCKAARIFLMEAFGGELGRHSSFVSANILSPSQFQSAVSWPAKVQGPVLAATPEDTAEGNTSRYTVVIENFASSDLIGVALAGEGQEVDLGIVNPSALLPRFAHESENDAYTLDQDLAQAGAIVQQIVLSEEGADVQMTNQSLAIVRDPLMDFILHYVTSKGVTTLQTSAMRNALRKLQGKKTAKDSSAYDGPERTTAWSSVTVASGAVEGAIVATDSRLGHSLIASISDGSLTPVNVSESRYLHELEHLVKPHEETNEQRIPRISNPSDAAMTSLDNVPPLYEAIEPLLKKVSSGLAGMGKIVGSETPSKDITPEKMAVALSVKERCDKEVVLPLMELKGVVKARRELLVAMLENQMKQIAALTTSIKQMKDRMAVISEKSEKAQDNAAQLAKRSDAVLQASRDLLPTLTQAEYDYFRTLKNMDKQAKNFIGAFERIDQSLNHLRGNMDGRRNAYQINLDHSIVTEADQLLDGVELEIPKLMGKFESNMRRVQEMAQTTGLKLEN